MHHHPNYREHNRAARNLNTDHENDRRHREMPVGRGVSGKASPYMMWLTSDGRRRFLNTYGRTYNDRDPDDKAKMSDFWANVPVDQKNELKRQAEEANVPQNYLKKREETRKMNRAMQHRNLEEHNEKEKAHKQSLVEQRKIGVDIVPASLEIPNIHVDDDLNSFCDQTAGQARIRLKAILKTGQTWGPSHLYQFVSIAPLIYTYKMALNRLASYPAEISITTFHLKTGLRETQTRFIEYDPEWFHGNGPEDEATANNRRDYANLLNIPEYGMTADNTMTPDMAMAWLHDELTQCKANQILCDKNAFNFVFYGLKMLARYTGLNAVHYFKNVLMEQIVSIQDFTQALLEEAPLIIPRSNMWSREQINNAFMFYDLIPCSDQNRICPTHAVMTTSHKLNCTGAHSARMLQNFFYIIRQNKLADIHNYCDGPAHRPCQVIPTEMKETLYNARTITRYQENGFKEGEKSERVPEEPTQENEDWPQEYPFEEVDSDDDDEDLPNVYANGADWHFWGENPNAATATATNHADPAPATAFAFRGNFFSHSRVDPDELVPREGAQDMQTYKPYGVEPNPKRFEVPQIECILSIEESERFFQRMKEKRKVYHPVLLSCV